MHHRIKNNLQVLSGLITLQMEGLEDEKTKDALRANESRLVAMNLIHSKLYSDHTLTLVEMNVYLTRLLYHISKSYGDWGGNPVHSHTEIDDISLDAEKAVAIGLIVNELVTNAYKYAFDGRGGNLYLEFKRIGKTKAGLCLRDDGKGFDSPLQQSGESFGLKLVNLMARQLGTALTVENQNGMYWKMEIEL
jgi:two-component sensor histidine kinase